MTDSCGNTTCNDMTGTNHTTTYGDANNYTVLSSGSNVSYTPSGDTNAYLTKITDPLVHISSFSYDFNNGQLTKFTDANSQSTTYIYNDTLARLTEFDNPDGGQTTHAYTDTVPPSVSTTTIIDNTITPPYTTSGTTLMDGLGRVSQQQLTTDLEGTDYTNTTYDGLGHIWKQSNPHRSSSSTTDGTTANLYDALGRACLMVPPDITTIPSTCPTSAPAGDVFTSYNGNCTTVTDDGESAQILLRWPG